jgi:hypothetical protein
VRWLASSLAGQFQGMSLSEARSRPQIDEPGERIGEVALRMDAIELTGFDQRGDASPVLCALVMAGEECVLAGCFFQWCRAQWIGFCGFGLLGAPTTGGLLDDLRNPVERFAGDRRLAA